jgi:sec-independent protein translocase protein TatB
MELFNIGPVEFLLILIVMFILLGPDGMIRTARQIGSWIRIIVRSPMWRDVMGYSQEIRELPQKIVRETGLDEDLAEIRKTTQAASDEVKQSMQDANQEVKKSLDEVGSVKVEVNTQPSPQSQQDNHQPAPEKQTGSEIQQSVTTNAIPYVQTADKYGNSSDDEED